MRKPTNQPCDAPSPVSAVPVLAQMLRPGKLPLPAQELDFRIDGRGMSEEEIISEAVLYTYDVLWDSGKLRSHREDFEKLRGEYQIRREFPAFTVHLHEEGTAAAAKLEALGFNVIESSR